MRALVAAVHQLADARRGGRDDAGGERGGEHVRPADEPQDLELRMVRHAEAPDGADALAEGADNEVDIVEYPLRLGDAAAMFADEAHRMRLVDQYHRAIFLRNADPFLQRRDVAEHRIDALEHAELARKSTRLNSSH